MPRTKSDVLGDLEAKISSAKFSLVERNAKLTVLEGMELDACIEMTNALRKRNKAYQACRSYWISGNGAPTSVLGPYWDAIREWESLFDAFDEAKSKVIDQIDVVQDKVIEISALEAELAELKRVASMPQAKATVLKKKGPVRVLKGQEHLKAINAKIAKLKAMRSPPTEKRKHLIERLEAKRKEILNEISRASSRA